MKTLTRNPGSLYDREMRAFQRALITRVLLEHGGNRTHAARHLGIDRTHVISLIRRLGIRIPGRHGGAWPRQREAS